MKTAIATFITMLAVGFSIAQTPTPTPKPTLFVQTSFKSETVFVDAADLEAKEREMRAAKYTLIDGTDVVFKRLTESAPINGRVSITAFYGK